MNKAIHNPINPIIIVPIDKIFFVVFSSKVFFIIVPTSYMTCVVASTKKESKDDIIAPKIPTTVIPFNTGG